MRLFKLKLLNGSFLLSIALILNFTDVLAHPTPNPKKSNSYLFRFGQVDYDSAPVNSNNSENPNLFREEWRKLQDEGLVKLVAEMIDDGRL